MERKENLHDPELWEAFRRLRAVRLAREELADLERDARASRLRMATHQPGGKGVVRSEVGFGDFDLEDIGVYRWECSCGFEVICSGMPGPCSSCDGTDWSYSSSPSS